MSRFHVTVTFDYDWPDYTFEATEPLDILKEEADGYKDLPISEIFDNLCYLYEESSKRSFKLQILNEKEYPIIIEEKE